MQHISDIAPRVSEPGSGQSTPPPQIAPGEHEKLALIDGVFTGLWGDLWAGSKDRPPRMDFEDPDRVSLLPWLAVVRHYTVPEVRVACDLVCNTYEGRYALNANQFVPYLRDARADLRIRQERAEADRRAKLPPPDKGSEARQIALNAARARMAQRVAGIAIGDSESDVDLSFVDDIPFERARCVDLDYTRKLYAEVERRFRAAGW